MSVFISWYNPSDTHWADSSIRKNAYFPAEQWKSTGQVFYCPSAPQTASWANSSTKVQNGRTTYFVLNNIQRDFENPDKAHGGKMHMFDPSHTLAQDWIIKPAAGGTKQDLYTNSHTSGGNVMPVNGSVTFHPNGDFEFDRSPCTGLEDNDSYLLKPTAHSW